MYSGCSYNTRGNKHAQYYISFIIIHAARIVVSNIFCSKAIQGSVYGFAGAGRFTAGPNREIAVFGRRIRIFGRYAADPGITVLYFLASAHF